MRSGKTWIGVATAALICAGLGAVGGSQIAVAENASSKVAGPDPSPKPAPDYPVNDRGQTYGVDSERIEDEPDLIRAEATNGRVGYVMATDLAPPDFKSPEEAMAWSEEQENRSTPESVPVYASDGKTLVGEFTISPAEGFDLSEP